MRVSTEVSLAIAQAIAQATLRKHPTVGPPHLVAALLATRSMRRRVRLRGVDADFLLAHADAFVEAQAPSSAYRDAAAPSLSAGVDGVLRRGGLLPWSRLEGEEVVQALASAPELRAGYRAYRIDTSIVDAVVSGARDRANARRDLPDVADAFAVVLERHPELRGGLESCGVDPDRLALARAGAISRVTKPAIELLEKQGWPAVTAGALAAYALRELAPAARVPVVVLGDAVAQLLHGAASGAPVPGDEEDAEVVLVDDPVTTMPAVELVLLTVFEFEPKRARDVMYAVHLDGERAVAQSRGRDAKELAHRALVFARRHGWPLRVYARPRKGSA